MVLGRENKIILDTSICGADDVRELLNEYIQKNIKLIVTSVTIRELDSLQQMRKHNVDGADARYILRLAAKDQDGFECVSISEPHQNPDNNIINFCLKDKKNYVLLTADKVMSLNARMQGINVIFLEKEVEEECTFNHTIKVGKDIIIPAPDFHTEKMDLRVISSEDKSEYDEGPYKLKIGDEILMLVRKDSFYSFIVFKIITESERQNCRQEYRRRIYYDNVATVNNIKQATYKKFCKDIIYADREKNKIS